MYIICEVHPYTGTRTCTVCGAELRSYIFRKKKLAQSIHLQRLKIKPILLFEVDINWGEYKCCHHNSIDTYIMEEK